MRADTSCVLFDLDGTLVDSAGDLAGAANDMRCARNLSALPLEPLRRMAGAGARGLLEVAFQVLPGEPEFEPLKVEFLDRYERRLLSTTQVFAHVRPLLHWLNAQQCSWGIVTNKAARFTVPLVEGLPELVGAAVVISGDTTPHIKPHPAPLLEAAKRLAFPPEKCIYVGDDLRDMLAARAAAMRPLAAAWGYLGESGSVSEWPSELVLPNGEALLNWLQMP
jgi:N-acetyl-D-muramate 6-phosphate phosphatase